MAEDANKNIGTEQNQDTGATGTEKTYTQAELDELLQKEGDRRVTEALKKAEKKNADKVKEAQKLAAMNEQQKYEYELEQREKAIEEKERALTLAENKNAASKILAEKGISLDLVNFVVAEDAETMNANISLLEKAFMASVKNEITKRQASKTPNLNLPREKAITKADIKNLTAKELQEIKRDNPELFKTLIS